MKILLDTCVWGGVKSGLEAAGYDVIWSGEWETDPGDEEYKHSIGGNSYLFKHLPMFNSK
ncbi:MAG: hypothetical protein Kow00121_61370 [Elainellaceae cyanobacterium]